MFPDNWLLPSLELIDRVIAIEKAYTVSRIRVLQNLPGNPIGVEVRDLGHGAVALMAKHFPNPNFNKVAGLKAAQVRDIEGLARWYRDSNVKLRFETLPREGDGELGRELSRLGLYPSEFHTALVRGVDPIPDVDVAAVEQVTDAAMMEEFLNAYGAGWGVPDVAGFKRNVRGWLGQTGWSLFLARVDRRPAATAILYTQGDAGYLADASCDPAFRRHGLHAALLARRIAEARAAGARFVCSGAAFLSTSHRNMERAGMRILFNRAIWTALSEA